MKNTLLLLVAWALLLTPSARAQTVDVEARAQIAAIAADVAAIKAAMKITTPATQPTTAPVIVAPVPTVTAKPVTLPAITRTLNQATQSDLASSIDYTGARVAIAANGRLVAWNNVRLANATIKTTPGVDYGAVQLKGPGAKLENVVFDDGGGSLIEAVGENQLISNVSAQTFSHYAVFCTDAKSITIRKLYIKGGSTAQSAVRFGTKDLDFCSGILSDFVIDWTTGVGSSALRGNFAGVVENGLIRGRVVGLNPQDNDDEGMAHCVYVFVGNFPGGQMRAANMADCIAAVKAARARGVTSITELCKIAMAVARDKQGNTIAGNVDATVAARKRLLARRSDVIFRAVSFENAPLRWAAGTKYDLRSCMLSGPKLFDNPTDAYPTPELLQPGDVSRPTPDITFTDCVFSTPGRTLADFIAQVKSLGVKLRGNNTFNGQPTGAVGIVISPGLDAEIARAA